MQTILTFAVDSTTTIKVNLYNDVWKELGNINHAVFDQTYQTTAFLHILLQIWSTFTWDLPTP